MCVRERDRENGRERERTEEKEKEKEKERERERAHPYLGPCCSSLKMCTVSVLLEAQRNWASGLKDRELMFTYLVVNTHTYTHVK